MTDVAARLRTFAAEFDRHFAVYLDHRENVPSRLHEAVVYSALAPGKRVRPYLVVQCCELVGGSATDAWPVAAAVECVHAFSLIHDDLPAMDNDDVRRGRPTCHKQFDEATAILAGDALVVLGIELLVQHVRDAGIARRLVTELCHGTGWAGMIGGQAAELSAGSSPADLKLTQAIHERKTAGLFRAACRMGAIVGRGHDEAVDRIGRFGEKLGLAFQIADDLLDVNEPSKGNQTYPRCMGVERSRDAAQQTATEAIEAIESFGASAEPLRELCRYVIYRDY